MLLTRVLSAAVYGPLLVAAAYFGGPLLWVVVSFAVIVGLVELDRLFRAGGQRAWPALTVPLGLGLVALAALGRPDLGRALLTVGVLAAVMLPAVWPSRAKAPDGVASVFGLAYVAWLGSHFILLRDLPQGMPVFFVGLLGTWIFDSGSYFAGRALGRHKLAPSVSPGKSVEGLVGGILAGAVGITWLGMAWLKLAFAPSLILAAVVMVAAQLGDLAESALKRHSGVKDSGNLIPGHGGILDRFDSLLAVMPAVYYLWVIWLGA